MERDLIPISVVYARPDSQTLIELNVAPGTTVGEAVALSGLAARFDEINTLTVQCAIFGRVVSSTYRVAPRDRVEILRPLLIDPKESRRQAAARAKR